MPPVAPNLKPSFAEYAKREESSEAKHEFLDGEVFAMAGGTPEHSALAAAVGNALGVQLAAGDCRPFNADLHVMTATGLGTYPDVTIVCGKLERLPDAHRTVTNPTLIVEVLSESTEAYDRGKKFEHYRSMPSLKEYVLVSFREPLVESHLRNADGSWTTTFAAAHETLALRAIDARLDVDEIYRGLTQVDGAMHLP